MLVAIAKRTRNSWEPSKYKRTQEEERKLKEPEAD